MKLRSLLFVPADSERKFAKANGIGADALILDLEDSVAPPRKALARGMVKDLLGSAAAQLGVSGADQSARKRADARRSGGGGPPRSRRHPDPEGQRHCRISN